MIFLESFAQLKSQPIYNYTGISPSGSSTVGLVSEIIENRAGQIPGEGIIDAERGGYVVLATDGGPGRRCDHV